ncbi:peptidase [Sphaerisporangium album]|uniref:Peptidase n=1 Tax=Sphaerisporangium album TaxID=509200 RepID=A0A367FSK3_9ACTN|nr:peptidase [Sphaerisporangium album]
MVGGVLGAIAAVFVLLVIGGALLAGSKSGGTTTSPVAIPTYEPYTPGPRPSFTYTPVEPRPTRSTGSRPDTTPRTTRPVLNTTLTGNSVYKAGSLPRTSCRAKATNVFDNAQLKALILATSKCMNKTWAAALGRVGIPFSPPNYAITARGGRGACGDFPHKGSIVPYYCPRNSTIYGSTSAMAQGRGNQRGYGSLSSWHGAFTGMFAHEYGHHVQHLTGLEDSWWSKTLASRTTSGRLALSRRYELQANCFSGLWMRSVAASYPITPARRNALYYFFSNVGDWPGYPRDHGSPPNSGRWFRQGYERLKTYQCNTWLAPASTTS